MEPKQIQSIIESMLFLWAQPLSANKIANVLDISVSEVKGHLNQMMEYYISQNRGIRLVEIDKSYQLVTDINNHMWLEKLCSKAPAKGLSHSSLEVLAIIAYMQPVTKAEIEDIRGVKSDSSIKHLIDREFIEEQGRLQRIGKPILYGTTRMFLTAFGFSSLNELPELTDFETVDFLFNKSNVENE